jgi:hypothetical protein
MAEIEKFFDCRGQNSKNRAVPAGGSVPERAEAQNRMVNSPWTSTVWVYSRLGVLKN